MSLLLRFSSQLRVFDAPKATLKTLKRLTPYEAGDEDDEEGRAERAFLPSLGLSNKAGDGQVEDEVEEDVELTKAGDEGCGVLSEVRGCEELSDELKGCTYVKCNIRSASTLPSSLKGCAYVKCNIRSASTLRSSLKGAIGGLSVRRRCFCTQRCCWHISNATQQPFLPLASLITEGPWGRQPLARDGEALRSRLGDSLPRVDGTVS